jgi:hypothetical protein
MLHEDRVQNLKTGDLFGEHLTRDATQQSIIRKNVSFLESDTNVWNCQGRLLCLSGQEHLCHNKMQFSWNIELQPKVLSLYPKMSVILLIRLTKRVKCISWSVFWVWSTLPVSSGQMQWYFVLPNALSLPRRPLGSGWIYYSFFPCFALDFLPKDPFVQSIQSSLLIQHHKRVSSFLIVIYADVHTSVESLE